MDSLQAQLQTEVAQILALLTELTGLPSRWSGKVPLVVQADFKGRKPFSCDILLDAELCQSDLRWPTIIHEAFHAISAGYHPTDYRAFRGGRRE